MKILPLIVLAACVVMQVSARPQEDGEGRAVPPRGLLKRGLPKGKQTTTTTTEPPQEAEYDEDYPAEGENQEPSTETPPSSTEGKKLVAGGVRPFRSNTDLLETLKRRRAQAAEAKLHGQSNHASSAAASSQDIVSEAPSKSSYSKKQFNRAPARDSNNEESPAASSSKPSRSRFGRPAARSVPEAEPEEQNEAAAPAPSRTGRTFVRRGGN
ncbi:uncharacterized protein LOC128682980 [Plodia interpunctella]|uniref:uncharacterized protein LOC128682980 n=1 Tax=Plodia interpunctella TaxID=58824 RepID=UPI002367D128|nr:uncharacterized protein LOC128682980 [Plodia interpunctella]